MFCPSEDDHVVISTEVFATALLQGRRECRELHGTGKLKEDAERADEWDWCHWLQDKMLNYKNKVSAHSRINRLVCLFWKILITV